MTALDSRLRIVLLVAGIYAGALVVPEGGARVTAAENGESLDQAVRRNVATMLDHHRKATVLDPQRDVVWVAPPMGDLKLFDTLDSQVFVALATPRGSTERDLFKLEARVTPYGRIYEVRRVINLTRTRAADDAMLTVRGSKVASAVRYQGRVVGIDVRDLRGEVPARVGTEDWGRMRRLGNEITNIEETGSAAGIDFDHYLVDTPTADLVLRWEPDEDVLLLLAKDGGVQARIDTAAHTTEGALALTHMPPPQKMRYQFLNWLADRGRGLADRGLLPEWAGNSIELMKEVYFKAKEVQAEVEEVAAPEPVVEEEVEVVEEAVERARLQAEQSTRPWPPGPLEPMLGERAKGEGLWEVVGKDVVTYQDNAPAPFYRTYLRAEKNYRRKKVYIVAWDPEQVQMLARAGTHEPVPETGHRGDGRIPRKKEHLERVVAGFNGGFQTSHISYGMMVDKKLLLNPKPNGATLGVWRDGRTAFGNWKLYGKVPKDLMSFRQNLSALVDFGKFNPFRRNRFGWSRGVAGVEDGKTIRTAVCFTNDGYGMFLFSEFSDARRFGEAALQANCEYAVHLDMNRGHTGFEFYKRIEFGPTEGTEKLAFEELSLRFAGTNIHPRYKPMKSPTRYLGVDYRDFFYLRLRNVVPGADLDGAGQWQVEGLPHNAEFPHRLATATKTVGDGRLRVLQLDPRGLSLSLIEPDGATNVDTLIGTIPTGVSPGGEAASLKLAGATIEGATLKDAPTEALPQATVWAEDEHGFVWIVDVRDATLADATALLETRGISDPIWTVAAEGKTPESYVYQPTANRDGEQALIEVLLGESEGNIVIGLTTDVPRLQIHARERPSRLVRIFPEVKPRGMK